MSHHIINTQTSPNNHNNVMYLLTENNLIVFKRHKVYYVTLQPHHQYPTNYIVLRENYKKKIFLITMME